MNNMNIIPIHM